MSEDYRVELEIYNGPLDLLLYLIRREEVDIHDIPIARIAKQYIEYVEMLHEVDPNIAGDFLVLAATLMEIKTRMLLPTVEDESEQSDQLTVDPRSELVRQLLEYKAFKDASTELEEYRSTQDKKFPRIPVKIEEDTEKSVELEDVQIWDLFDAFSKVMDSIGHFASDHEVIYDDTPIETHQTDILERIKGVGKMKFSEIFAGSQTRSQVVGMFLAILELVRQQKVYAVQGENFDEIMIEENPDPPTAEQIQQQDREHEIRRQEEERQAKLAAERKESPLLADDQADLDDDDELADESEDEEEFIEDDEDEDEDEFADFDDEFHDDFDDDDGF